MVSDCNDSQTNSKFVSNILGKNFPRELKIPRNTETKKFINTLVNKGMSTILKNQSSHDIRI